MHTRRIKQRHWWRVLLMLAVIPALQNCSRIDGSVELNNHNGEPYSFSGAKVEVFDLNPSIVLPGQNRIPKGLGGVEDDGRAIALQVITAGIDDNALYDVEISCSTNNATDACNVESALHVVLKGSQLMAGDWKANVLTEIAFQNIAYYIATGYSAAETSQILENNANALLLALPAGVQKNYDDLVAWSAAETDAIKRANLINTISESLAAGIPDGDLKVFAQQAVSAELSSVNLTTYGNNQYGRLIDGYAYLYGDNMPITIVDIRDPNAIKLDGVIAEGYGGSYTVSGDFLYLAGIDASSSDALYIYDISNRQQPTVAGQLALPFEPSPMEASAGYVYTGGNNILHIFDATNPAAPTEVGTLNIAIGYMLVVGKQVYVSNASGIHIVDVSTPSAPHIVGDLPAAGYLTIIGNYAYVTVPGAAASDPVQLQVFAIGDPTAPTLVSELTLAAGTSGLTVVGTRAYADTSATVQILDISNAAAPVLADSFPNKVPSGIRLNDAAFFNYSGPTVSIIDPSIATQPVVGSGFMAIEKFAASLITAAGRYIYVPNRDDTLSEGFKVFDLIVPLAPALITTFTDSHALSSVAVSGNYAYLADAEFGTVQIADISNTAAPVRLDARVRLDPEELPGIGKLVVAGNRLFAPWRHDAYDDGDMGYGEQGCNNPYHDGDVGGVFAIDISVPQSPILKGHICAPEGANTVAASGNYAYIGNGNGSLQVVDFTDAAQPTLTESLNLSATANSSAIVDGYLWITESSGIEVFNISNPAAPVLSTRLAVPGNTTAIEIEGNRVYVAAGLSGVHIFDISTPALPQLVGNVSTDLPAQSAFVEGGYLYASTRDGLEIFKAFPGSL